jgi:hypothetical protein
MHALHGQGAFIGLMRSFFSPNSLTDESFVDRIRDCHSQLLANPGDVVTMGFASDKSRKRNLVYGSAQLRISQLIGFQYAISDYDVSPGALQSDRHGI